MTATKTTNGRAKVRRARKKASGESRVKTVAAEPEVRRVSGGQCDAIGIHPADAVDFTRIGGGLDKTETELEVAELALRRGCAIGHDCAPEAALGFLALLQRRVPFALLSVYDGNSEYLWVKRGPCASAVAADITPDEAGDVQGRMFALSADDIELLDMLVEDAAISDVTGLSATDLSIFINNNGTAEDQAEALVAVVPIARRVYERN